MFFEYDKQTSLDLELFQNDRTEKCLFSVFGRTVTKGGQETVLRLFKTPTFDINSLEGRKAEIHFFFKNKPHLKLNSEYCAFIEHYLAINKNPLRDNIIDATYNGIMNLISPDGDYWIISNGIRYIIQLLIDLKNFIEETDELEVPLTLKEDFAEVKKFLSIKILWKIMLNPPQQAENLAYSVINALDHFFRESHKHQLREVIQIIYKIDVLQTLSSIMKSEGYTLPQYTFESGIVFEMTDGFHPFLSSPVTNSFTVQNNSSLCFLTGPNMSGKSTFLKTIGIMIYLSHLGFPVPAKNLKTSVFNGLYTTINLSDNINFGYSHFYSEVKRVKDIAGKISSEKKLVIIFDELFRGTNVKDAFDASLAIVSKIAKIKNNLFYISSHILEVAENLDNKENVVFKCFESSLINETPVYDYKLKEGISQERIGMVIIRNERIIEILNEVTEKQYERTNANYTN